MSLILLSLVWRNSPISPKFIAYNLSGSISTISSCINLKSLSHPICSKFISYCETVDAVPCKIYKSVSLLCKLVNLMNLLKIGWLRDIKHSVRSPVSQVFHKKFQFWDGAGGVEVLKSRVKVFHEKFQFWGKGTTI